MKELLASESEALVFVLLILMTDELDPRKGIEPSEPLH